MEFKNLAEVTQLTEVPEGASVLAATAEGEVVRVPGDGLGGGGGSNELLVTFTPGSNVGELYSSISYADVHQAISNGTRAVGTVSALGTLHSIPAYDVGTGMIAFLFIGTNADTTPSVVAMVIRMFEDGSITFNQVNFALEQ